MATTDDADLTKDPGTEEDVPTTNDEVRDALTEGDDGPVDPDDILAPAPTAEEVKEDLDAVKEPPPDSLNMHSEKTVDEHDTQGSDAIRAQYAAAEMGTSTDFSHLGYQIAQFDSSGNNVLDALAFPSQGSLDAARAVERRQGILLSLIHI